MECRPLQSGVTVSPPYQEPQDGDPNMASKQPDETQDVIRLHEWFTKVGGNIDLGQSLLKSLETSKDGDKITIVLKKKKPKKDANADID